MVVFYSDKNKLCQLEYNLYYDKAEFWRKFLQMKFNKPIQSVNTVDKLKEDIKRLLKPNTKM
tara:strand:- start:632 stop:817 length:186 start_codon:yes stop_codon:yes gene_type:complete